MNRWMSVCVMAVSLACWAGPAPADEAAKVQRLGIGDPSPAKALEAGGGERRAAGLTRLVASLTEHLLVTFQKTQRFDVVARNNLVQIIAEQQLPKDLLVANDLKALPGQIKGLDYLVVTTVTHFDDADVGIEIEGMPLRVEGRRVSATAVVKVYNTTSGSLLRAVNVPVQLDEKQANRVPRRGINPAAPNDALIDAVAVEIARQAAMRVAQDLAPAEVVSIANDQVTLDWGEGMGVESGQVWEVFALGKVMKNRQGRELGREEVKMGEIRITAVRAETATGDVQGENRGIAEGAVARLKPSAQAPAAGPKAARDPRAN